MRDFVIQFWVWIEQLRFDTAVVIEEEMVERRGSGLKERVEVEIRERTFTKAIQIESASLISD